MTIEQFIAWKINTWQNDISYLASRVAVYEAEIERGITDHERLLERHRASLRVFQHELRMVKAVWLARQGSTPMPPVLVVWYRWIQAAAVTYATNPRENEAQNTIDRAAALAERDSALNDIVKVSAA